MWGALSAAPLFRVAIATHRFISRGEFVTGGNRHGILAKPAAIRATIQPQSFGDGVTLCLKAPGKFGQFRLHLGQGVKGVFRDVAFALVVL